MDEPQGRRWLAWAVARHMHRRTGRRAAWTSKRFAGAAAARMQPSEGGAAHLVRRRSVHHGKLAAQPCRLTLLRGQPRPQDCDLRPAQDVGPKETDTPQHDTGPACRRALRQAGTQARSSGRASSSSGRGCGAGGACLGQHRAPLLLQASVLGGEGLPGPATMAWLLVIVVSSAGGRGSGSTPTPICTEKTLRHACMQLSTASSPPGAAAGHPAPSGAAGARVGQSRGWRLAASASAFPPPSGKPSRHRSQHRPARWGSRLAGGPFLWRR